MSARTKARKRALDVLFEAEQRETEVIPLLAERLRQPGTEAALPQYSVEIVEGVHDHWERIDELISTHAHGWTIGQLPAVYRAVLRIGIWEILFKDDVPDAVAVDEAVELAGALSTDASQESVNGWNGWVVELKSHHLA